MNGNKFTKTAIHILSSDGTLEKLPEFIAKCVAGLDAFPPGRVHVATLARYIVQLLQAVDEMAGGNKEYLSGVEGKLYAAREENRKLSDSVENLVRIKDELTERIYALNSQLDVYERIYGERVSVLSRNRNDVPKVTHHMTTRQP